MLREMTVCYSNSADGDGDGFGGVFWIFCC